MSSEETIIPKGFAPITQHAKKLADLRKEHREIATAVKMHYAMHAYDAEEKEEKARAHEDAAAALRLEARQSREASEAKDPELFEAYINIQKEVEIAETTLRREIVSLDAKLFGETNRYSANGLSFTVSKAPRAITYLPSLLTSFPQLRHAQVDGNPVVEESVNASLLERLISRGEFRQEDAEPHMKVTLMKNPSVSLKNAEGDGEGP